MAQPCGGVKEAFDAGDYEVWRLRYVNMEGFSRAQKSGMIDWKVWRKSCRLVLGDRTTRCYGLTGSAFFRSSQTWINQYVRLFLVRRRQLWPLKNIPVCMWWVCAKLKEKSTWGLVGACGGGLTTSWYRALVWHVGFSSFAAALMCRQTKKLEKHTVNSVMCRREQLFGRLRCLKHICGFCVRTSPESYFISTRAAQYVGSASLVQ